MARATSPSHRRTLRCLLVVALALGALALLAAPALGGTFTPQTGGSPNANRIDSLYRVALWIALVIFFAVEGALVYSLVRFRARRGAMAAQIRGHARLEMGWTVGAAVILVALAVLTFAKLDSIRTPPNSGPGEAQLAGRPALYATLDRRLPPNGKSLNIQVNGQQYLWRFTYPGGGPTGFGGPYSYQEMVVPTDTTVTLDVVSQDVAHSWWIPALGGKVDAVPGYVNHTWFKIHKPGLYAGECAEMCGRRHADMIAVVRAVDPDRFEAWLAQRQADIQAANKAAESARARIARQGGLAGSP